MASLASALRYAARQFFAARVFTTAAVVTLALGIGGTTAIFTLIHRVMLQSLPVADPASLYRIGDADNCCIQGGPQDRWGMFSFAFFERMKAETSEFAQLTAFQAGGFRKSVRRDSVETAARALRTEFVTGNYFATLGVGAFGGRTLTDDDDREGAAPVMVLSHHAWQTIYGGDRSVLGSTFVIDGQPFTAIGIAPPSFFGETLRGDPPDLWLPMHQEPVFGRESSLVKQPASAWLRVIGRARPGARLDGVAARLTGVLRQWIQYDAGYPSDFMPDIIRALPKQVINVVPAGSGVMVLKERYQRSLQILMAVCALVLLIACANVANLLLARGISRRAQTAVRLAVGASTRHLVTQALVESVVLAVAGGAAGLLVAFGAARLLLALAFSNVQFLPISAAPSLTVLLFAFSVALVTGVLFGTAPSWLAARTNPIDALRGSGRGTTDRSSLVRKALLAVQATLSVVLVAGATMLGRSLNQLEGQDFGFAVNDHVLVSLNRLPATYSGPALASTYRRIEDRLRQLPGVRGAALALYNPLTDNWGEGIIVAGHPPQPFGGGGRSASWDRVSATYLQDLGRRLRRGRWFTEGDNDKSALVAIVNEGFVKRFFKSDEDPIGQHFGFDLPENAGTFEIIGIVGDAKFAGFDLDKPARPMLYVPLAQTVEYQRPMLKSLERQSHIIGGLLLVTNLGPGALQLVLTRTLAEVDPNLTIVNVRTLQDQANLSFDQERSVASLAGLFGIVALLLAGVGLYGVTAYSVAQRTNEIGIRMALGADRQRVTGLILRGAFARVAAGLVLGVPLAIGAGRLIASQLYGVRFWDPVALSSAAAALAFCALVASLIPATRAASISPTTALRME